MEEEERERDNDSSGNVTPVVATMTEGDTAETMELGKEREEKVDSMAREEETLPAIPTTIQLQISFHIIMQFNNIIYNLTCTGT